MHIKSKLVVILKFHLLATAKNLFSPQSALLVTKQNLTLYISVLISLVSKM